MKLRIVITSALASNQQNCFSIFESSCHLPYVPHTTSHCPFLSLASSQESCKFQFCTWLFDPFRNRTRDHRFSRKCSILLTTLTWCHSRLILLRLLFDLHYKSTIKPCRSTINHQSYSIIFFFLGKNSPSHLFHWNSVDPRNQNQWLRLVVHACW